MSCDRFSHDTLAWAITSFMFDVLSLWLSKTIYRELGLDQISIYLYQINKIKITIFFFFLNAIFWKNEWKFFLIYPIYSENIKIFHNYFENKITIKMSNQYWMYTFMTSSLNIIFYNYFYLISNLIEFRNPHIHFYPRLGFQPEPGFTRKYRIDKKLFHSYPLIIKYR